jgi:hypothetical protein
MTYIEDNGYIHIDKSVETDTQFVPIYEIVGNKNKPKIAPDKTSLTISEVATISLQWLVFDLISETYVDDTQNTTPFNVTVSGQTGDIIPTNGAGEFTFSSAEAGIYKIIVNGEEIEVTVNA